MKRLFVLIGTAAGVFVAQAQIPGPNVNMIAGTEWPKGDPFLNRQNEGAGAVSSRNPLTLFASGNDYRTVDIPFPPDDGRVVGDAWLGAYRSYNGGETWLSSLLPGYPQDTSPEGLASPIKGFAVATDPMVQAGTHGLFYQLGLAFDRGNNAASALFVAVWQDLNNKENGERIRYRRTAVLDTGTAGASLDKPWMAADIARGGSIGSATCTFDGATFTSGNLYVVGTKFVGVDPQRPQNNPTAQVLVYRSQDCGASFPLVTKVSESINLSNGAVAAVDPADGTLYVVWRQLQSGNQGDGIVWTKSTDGGKSFSKSANAFSFPAGQLFDQGGTTTTFRALSLPSMVVDAGGTVYMTFSLRNGQGDARVVVSTLPKNSKNWTPLVQIDNYPGRGHQFFPALAYISEQLGIVYYDSRDDGTKSILTCSGSPKVCTESRVPVKPGLNPQTLFGPFIDDAGTPVRHTIDVRFVQFPAGQATPRPSVKVSQYKYAFNTVSGRVEQVQYNAPNLPMFVQGTRPFIGDYIFLATQLIASDGNGGWKYNLSPTNVPVFHAIWADNRDVQPPPLDATGKRDWTLYTPANTTSKLSIYDPAQMTPACNPAKPATGTRNQNLYYSQITGGLAVSLKQNAKNLTTAFNRSFAVNVRNNFEIVKYYRLSIEAPAGLNASFSYFGSQLTLDVAVPARSSISRTVFVRSGTPKGQVNVSVKELTGVVLDPSGQVTNGTIDPAGQQSTLTVNPDITNPDIVNPDIITFQATNPDITNPDINNPQITTAEIYNPTITNPDIINPDIVNPDISTIDISSPQIVNPDIVNPDIISPDIINPDISTVRIINPDIVSPDIVSPDIVNPDIISPDIINPDITTIQIVSPDIVSPDIVNPDITNLTSGVTDFTWKITNKGNTGVSYNAKLLKTGPEFCCPQGCQATGTCPAGCYKCQLILRRTYPTPAAQGCTPAVTVQNVLVSSVLNPNLQDASQANTPDNSSVAKNATLSLGPGEAGRMTLRVIGLKTQTLPPGFVQPVAVSASGVVASDTSITITTFSLPFGVVGSLYNQTLTSIGGSGPTRTWTVFNGALPPGLNLTSAPDGSGLLSGTPTQGGTFQVTIQVKDFPQPLPGSSAVPPPHVDRQTYTFTVVEFKLNSVIPSKLFAKAGDVVTVTATVQNPGAVPATNVSVAPLQLGYSAGSTAAVSCGAASPASTSISPGGDQVFTYSCTGFTGNGKVSFSTQASATFGTNTFVQSPVVSSAEVAVDNVVPSLTVSGILAGGSVYTPGTWTNQDVTVTFACSDSTGVAQQPQSPQTVSTEGANQSVSASCTDQSGNSTTQSVTGINIDKQAPSITITAPADGATFTQGATLTANYVCSGVLSPVTTCIGPIASGATLSLTTSGPGSFTVTATDAAGNTATKTSNYTVNVAAQLTFIGYLSPLGAAGTYSGTQNLGSAVPVKFQLRDGSGAAIKDLAAVSSIRSVYTGPANAGSCPVSLSGTSFLLYSPTVGATGGSTFRIDNGSNTYTFNWDTSTGLPTGKGCYTIVSEFAPIYGGVSRVTSIRLN